MSAAHWQGVEGYRVLGTLYLHEEEFQVLAGLNLLRSEVLPVAWLQGSRGGAIGCALGPAGQGWSSPTPAGLRFSGFGHSSTSLLLWVGSPGHKAPQPHTFQELGIRV